MSDFRFFLASDGPRRAPWLAFSNDANSRLDSRLVAAIMPRAFCSLLAVLRGIVSLARKLNEHGFGSASGTLNRQIRFSPCKLRL